MSTMKSYTDIEQSKKLAEILPLESADMSWCESSVKEVNYTDEYSVHTHTIQEIQECFNEVLNGWDKHWKLIPCWSLAALIAVLPCWYDMHPTERRVALSCDYGNEVAVISDNLVDACVEMLLKLHELKLL